LSKFSGSKLSAKISVLAKCRKLAEIRASVASTSNDADKEAVKLLTITA